MDIRNSEKAITRARKRFAHAVRMGAEAQSDRAKARHHRRARNAMRAESDARWTFEQLAMCEAD